MLFSFNSFFFLTRKQPQSCHVKVKKAHIPYIRKTKFGRSPKGIFDYE